MCHTVQPKTHNYYYWLISESRIIPLKKRSWSQDSANGEKSLGFIFQSLGRSAFVIISWAMVRRKRVTEPPPILGTSSLLPPNLVESTWLLLNREANAGLQNSDPLLGHCWTCYQFWRNRLGCYQYTSIWWGECGFYRIATVFWNSESVTVFCRIDLGVIYILVYGEAGAGLHSWFQNHE